MTVNGTPIGDYNYRPAAATITYKAAYELEQARIYGEIPIQEWDEMPGNPEWINPLKGGRSKAHILMLYRMSNSVPAAASDAQARKSEQDAKRRRYS